MTQIRWDTPPHNIDKAQITDGPWGRYLVKRESKGARWFRATLNGQRTSYGGDTMEQAKQAIERVIRANYPEYNNA